MGSFNCTGFHSRLPITGGDEIVLILGLHQTAKDKFTDDIHELINKLRNQSVVLFQLSQQLMKELQVRLLDNLG